MFFIVFSFFPFSIVENQYLKDFLFLLNKDYKVPCRKRLRLILNEIYEEKKKALMQKLISANFIFLITDSWTSCQNYNYMSLTCHYLEGFQLRSFALGFKNLVNHKADYMRGAILEILDYFNLKSKVFSIATDNANTVRRAAIDLKFDQEPIRCMGHVLQLIVKKFIDPCDESFKSTEAEQSEPEISYFKVGGIVSKCRSIVCSFNHSSQLRFTKR